MPQFVLSFVLMKYGDRQIILSPLAVAIIALLLLFPQKALLAQERNLDYYVTAGIANNPQLKDIQNQVASSNIDSARLRATYKPQITGISYNTVSPITNGYGYDAALSNISIFNELINADQSITGRRNLHTQYANFTLTSDSIRNLKKITEQDLRRTITAQYITTYGDLQQLNFYSRIDSLLGRQETILKKLTENNIYRQTDYLIFLVTLKQQELQIKELRIQYQNDFATLNYLCGIFDTSSSILGVPEIALQGLPDAQTSVFFLRFFTDSLKLENAMRLVNYSYHPKVNAFANAGFSSSLLYDAYKNFGYSAGVNINVPIYDGHQRTLLQQKIKLLENTRVGYKDFFTLQYEQQTAQLKQQLRATEALTEEINSQISYTEGLININSKLLETGDAKITDFVIAINNYLSAKNLVTQNNISRMQIINQLNYWSR